MSSIVTSTYRSYQKQFRSLFSLGIALVAGQERLVSTNFASFI